MKKREIEKIPYRVPEKSKKKYTATAFMENVKEIPHLFVEIYELGEVPNLRMVFTEEDWGIYKPNDNEWSAAGIEDCYDNLIWEHGEKKRGDQTEMIPAEQEIVFRFFREHAPERYCNSWEDALARLIDNIKVKRRRERDERRIERLKDRMKNTPPLPEDLESWAGRTMFHEHFLYYERHGRYAEVACSACGNVVTAAVKRKESLEGQLEHIIEIPINNHPGICPHCGAVGTWKAAGRTKGVYGLRKYCFVAQPYKESGAVIRYVEIEKIFRMEEFAGEKKTELVGAGESCIITEIARQYFEKGKKIQKDFHKCSSYSGEFWDDCNLCGMQNITIKEGFIYPKSYQNLKGTILQYSGAQEYQKHALRFNLMDYMERYMQYPQIEMFSKMQLYGVVDEMVACHLGIIRGSEAKTPEGFLGIRKEQMKSLIRKQGEVNYLRALQIERDLGQRWEEKDLEFVAKIGERQGELDLAMQYTTIRKVENYIEKIAGCTWNAECSHARNVLKQTARIYLDYLSMREQRGYDLGNTVFLFPKNLQGAHNQMAMEINDEKQKTREQEMDKAHPGIRQSYKRLRNQYFYEDERYLIRPARSAGEIVREGRVLHHCVGGNNYLRKHEEGTSTILLLRLQEMPETPYITIEIAGEKILQWYGEKDRKVDKKEVQPWLDAYVEQLKQRNAA